MTAYITRRLTQTILVIVIVSMLIFLVMRLLPGDPILIFISQSDFEKATEEYIQALRVEYGLDKPMARQYIDWILGLFRGDFGKSLVYKQSVGKLMAQCFPVTFHLAILSLIFSTILGLSAGVICAVRRGGALDAAVTSFANFGISVPQFWLGILMIYLFGLVLGWLPIQGYTYPFQDLWLSTKKMIMPVSCLTIVSLASICRQSRSSMLEVIRQDYIRTAWSKGLRERVIIMRHALKNGLIPIITLIGIHLSHIFGGSVLIETVFNIPGMGRLLVSAVFGRDYPIVQAGSLLIAITVVLSNLAVDISYGWLDPRVRYG